MEIRKGKENVMSSLKNIIMIIIIILLLLFSIKQQIDINTQISKNEELTSELEKWKSKNEKLEYEMSMSDDEYLEKQAKGNGEYLDPDSQHFTTDYIN